MANNRVRKFTDILEAQAFLNGAAIGGVAGRVAGIVGKTFKLKLPSIKSITFVAAATPPGGDPTALLLMDIKAQIEAVATDVRVNLINGKICVLEVAITGGVSVDKTGTSNGLLGFDSAVDTTGLVYKPAQVTPTPPCWVAVETSQDNSHVIFTWE